MSIIRIQKTENFSVIANHAANNASLSWRAKGLFFFLMTKPNNWKIKRDGLLNASKDGKDSTGNALRELETAGYLIRKRKQDAAGHWTWESTLHEQPVTIAGISGDGESAAGFSAAGQPGDLVNTDLIKTDKLKTGAAGAAPGASDGVGYSQNPTGQAQTDPAGELHLPGLAPTQTGLQRAVTVETQPLVEHYFNAFVKATGVKPIMNYPVFTAAARKALKDKIPPERLKKMMDRFFSDKRMAAQGFPPQAFWANLNRYNLEVNGVHYKGDRPDSSELVERARQRMAQRAGQKR